MATDWTTFHDNLETFMYKHKEIGGDFAGAGNTLENRKTSGAPSASASSRR